MDLARILDDEILPRVDKPSRYLGNEVNTVHKQADAVDVRLALVFPDLYDLGLGNLGLHILYALVNRLDWAWCERAYMPAPDMIAALRERGLPLFALESKDPLHALDGIGITLQTELTYTNILEIIDLSGLPLRAADRTAEHPLVFAGGPSVFNPEPLAPFMDFFVIGDGEDAVLEIAEVLRRDLGREATLEALAELEGVYVPSLYPFETLDDGRILPDPDAPRIRKRITSQLDPESFPTDYIVPFTQQVHDRVSLEVLRGCTQGCRFCQAGMTTRPVRERPIDDIEGLMRQTLENTGYEEVSLVSLSTCDYSQVRQMVDRAVGTAREQGASVSLPSLRLDSFSVDLADMVAETRKSGITFAPEAATPRMRAVINKWIPDEELLEMSAGAFGLGWGLVKLYFMIGLPTERDEDVEAIGDLAVRTLQEGRRARGSARVNLGVSTFVPKPFTPFQWAEQIRPEEAERRQRLLGSRISGHQSIKFGRHDPTETFLEGLITRADRRAADLIEAAWRHGARLDAWREHLDFEAWQRAIDEVGYDVDDALRARDLDERLPWDHLDILIDKEWLKADWERAVELQHAPDCRARKCHKCGVIDHERELCATMLRDNIKGRKKDADYQPLEREPHVEPEPVQRLWVRYSRTGQARFLTHLEAMNSWMRSFRRARVPLSYSQGYNPKPRLAFSSAVPVGEETMGDYLDITLRERIDPQEMLARLRSTLPDGFGVLAVQEVDPQDPSLMSLVEGGRYTLFFPGTDPRTLAERVAALRDAEELLVERTIDRKHEGRWKTYTYEQDIRSNLRAIELLEGDTAAVEITVVKVGSKPGKAREFVPLLTDDPANVRVLKRDTLLRTRQGELCSLSRWQTTRRARAAK